MNNLTLAMLRWVANDCTGGLPFPDPVAAAAILDALVDQGYLTYRGAVGSVPVLTDTGRAYLEAHADD